MITKIKHKLCIAPVFSHPCPPIPHWEILGPGLCVLLIWRLWTVSFFILWVRLICSTDGLIIPHLTHGVASGGVECWMKEPKLYSDESMKINQIRTRYQVFMMVMIHFVFWVMTPCSLVSVYQHAKEPTASIFRSKCWYPPNTLRVNIWRPQYKCSVNTIFWLTVASWLMHTRVVVVVVVVIVVIVDGVVVGADNDKVFKMVT